MQSIILRYFVSMLLVAAVSTIAVVWCHLSHLRTFQGPELLGLWSTHGVHLFDIFVVVVELALLAILSAVLIDGFYRR